MVPKKSSAAKVEVRIKGISTEQKSVMLVFQKVSGLSNNIITQTKSGASVRKLTGLRKFTNITLKRGYTSSARLWEWYDQTKAGHPKHAAVSISQFDPNGKLLVRFQADKAWPVKFEAFDLPAHSTEVAIETLELGHEGLKRKKP